MRTHRELPRPHTSFPTRRSSVPKGTTPLGDPFLAVLVAMDAEIGRHVDGLRQTGELDDTLIVFTSDNGPTIGANAPGSAAPYRGRKASLYEGGIRQPLIIRWPGHVAGGGRDARSVEIGRAHV